MACKCYHAEKNFLGKIGVCWGTKECEACSCGGDESKCDFYEEKRKKATPSKTNYIDVVTKSIEELAEWMEWHDYCPAPLQDAPCIGPDGEPRAEYDCYQCCLDWLQQEVQDV